MGFEVFNEMPLLFEYYWIFATRVGSTLGRKAFYYNIYMTLQHSFIPDLVGDLKMHLERLS
jgi:hypothetical protein